jgi:hypothetical protein
MTDVIYRIVPLTQRVNQVDQSPSLILVLQVQHRRLVNNAGFIRGGESDIVRTTQSLW